METFASRVKNARELRGWSQEELGKRVAQVLARRTPIGKAAVQKWESGETRLPEGDVVAALAIVLDMPHELLLWGTDRKPPGLRRTPSTPERKTPLTGE